MGTPGDAKSGFFRRHRRKLVVLGVLCILAAAGYVVAARYLLDMERYRRLAVDTIVERTGIDARIARIEADLFPSPRVVAHQIELNAPEGRATAGSVTAHLDLGGLFRREVVLSSIEIGDLAVGISADPADLAAVRDRVEKTWTDTRPAGGSSFAVSLDSIRAENARLYVGDDDAEFASLTVDVEDVLSDRIHIGLDAEVDGAGDDARLSGDIVVIRDRNARLWQLSGAASVRDADLTRLPFNNAPAGSVNADLQFTPAESGPLMTLRAAVDTPDHPALRGNLEADASWDGRWLRVARAVWDAAGANVAASGAIESGDRWRIDIKQARMSDAALDALLAMAERPRARFEADDGAFVDLQEFSIRPSDEGPLRLASGRLEFAGLAVIPAGEANLARAAHGIGGLLTVADNAVRIERISTAAAEFYGSLSPDFEAETLFVDVRGDADLSRLPWEAVRALEFVQRLEGQVHLARFAGTFSGDAALPADFVLDGDLTNGAVVYADEDVHIDARDIRGAFASSGDAIRTSLEGRTSDGAAIVVAGAYIVADSRWNGTLETDVSAAIPPIFVDEVVADWARPMAETLGVTKFDVDVTLPKSDRENATIEIVRPGDAQLNGRILFAGDGRFLSVTSEGTLAIEDPLPRYFPELTGSGYATYALAYEPAGRSLQVTFDGTGCDVVTQSILHKAAGTAFIARLHATVDKRFTVETFELDVDGAPAVRTTAPPQAGVIPFEIRLSALTPLLSDGSSAGGAVMARYDSNATSVELRFEGASFSMSDKLALDRVNGPLLIFKDSIATDGLEIHGARSDCTLRIARVGGRWTGGIEGRSFNVHAVTELVNAIDALMPDRNDDVVAARSFWDEPILGEFDVNLASVHYNRGSLRDVRFRIIGDERALRVRDLSVQPYAGALTASIAIVPDPAADAMLKLSMNATDLDARTINELFWMDDKAFFGTITGSLVFDAPLGDLETMLAGGNGSVTWHGANGSLGQIGFATKLLTALKTTDILNLRLRSLKDKGITYDAWDVDLKMTNGTVTVAQFFLDGGAYTMQADGTIDFANDQTDALVYVRPLESVGKVIKKVPLLGNLAAAVSTDLLGVPVKFTGSPYDVQASVAKELAKNLLTTPIRAGQGAVKSVTGSSESSAPKSGGEKPRAPDPDGSQPQ